MHKTSVYTLVNGNIKERAHRKQQKITKGDIARITLTVCQCAAESPFVIFAVFDDDDDDDEGRINFCVALSPKTRPTRTRNNKLKL